MSDKITIDALIKFTSKEYIKQFQQGKIYMNTLKYFKICENDVHRDELEGIEFFHQGSSVSPSIEIPNKEPLILTQKMD